MKITVNNLIALSMLAAAAPGFGKPFARGLIDLPSAINAKTPIGTIDDHPWLNPNISGVRIRTGWDNTEPADGVYNWVQIDECLALAVASGKFIGLGVGAGIACPPWLFGGVTFADGESVIDETTLTSLTANFTKSTNTKNLLTFSILARNPGGAAFRVLIPADEGVIVVPWDPVAKARWKRFIVALAARYDSNPQLQYLVMAGFQKTGECYLASDQADIDFFDASAVAAGYAATDVLPAGLVAWEATVKEIVAQYMTSFPNTPLIITGARPYGGDSQSAGQRAMTDIFSWGVATYPGRFGIMNSQLHATSASGYYLNAAIYDNHLTQPVGIQFLCSASGGNPDNLARLSNSPPFGDDVLLTPYDAVNNSLTQGVSFGCNYIEVYEDDINNPEFQTMLAAQKAALGLPAPPETPGNLRIVP
jgi:hypothetical protein